MDNRLGFPRPIVAGTVATLLAGIALAATTAGASAGAVRIPRLSWAPCHNGFQCATARVPLDYQHPGGARIRIAMIRHLATDRAHRAGTLFVNGGGPTAQIAPFVGGGYAAIPAALRARFDIITFDPRGFGSSSAVRCFPDAAAENKLLAGLPHGFPVGARQDAVWEKTWTRFDARCARHGGRILRHDTSTDVARDMNLLRQDVGARTLNFIGLSYATGLGAVYANLFPATVGRMVLDGNVDPVAWSKDGSLPWALRTRQDLATAATMRSFLNLCGRASTTACAFSAGTPTATRAKFGTLLRRLRQHPVSVGTPPQTFTYADAINDVPLGYLAFVRDWQSAAVLLQQLWSASARGNPPAADGAAVRGPLNQAATAAGYVGQEQGLAEECADTAGPRGTRAYEAAARLANARSGGIGLGLTWDEETCATWPTAASQDRYTGPWNHRIARPILVIGNTGDPVTPYRAAVAMSRDLARARLLTVDGYGHTEFYNPSTCAVSYEISYMETGELPPAGTVCQQATPPFPAP